MCKVFRDKKSPKGKRGGAPQGFLIASNKLGQSNGGKKGGRVPKSIKEESIALKNFRGEGKEKKMGKGGKKDLPKKVSE